MPQTKEKLETTIERETHLKFPSMYTLLFFNDDYTPMDFVQYILMTYSNLGLTKAKEVVWKIHVDGAASVGTYSKDIAETIAKAIHQESQKNHFPLKVKACPVNGD